MSKPNVVPRRWRVRFWSKCNYGGPPNGWEPRVIHEHWCITEAEGEGYRRRDHDWVRPYFMGGTVSTVLEYVEEGEPDERWEDDDETEWLPGADALWPEYLRRGGGDPADR